MFDVFNTVNSEEHEHWMDFMSTYCPHYICLSEEELRYTCYNVLRSRVIYVDDSRETPRSEA